MYRTWKSYFLVFIIVAFLRREAAQECETIEGVGVTNLDPLINNDDYDSFGMAVSVENKFNETVYLYYKDNETNPLLMGEITPHDSLEMNTFVGHHFFATTTPGQTESSKIDFDILPDTSYYALKPEDPMFEYSGIGEVTMNSEKRTRLHPAVKYLDQGRSTSVNARFRSLSSRQLDLFYDGGSYTNLQASLKMGQDTSSASYEGHSFFYTPHGQPKEILGRFHINKDQVLYLLNDPTHPASDYVMNLTKYELAYMEEYKNKTGIHWRSYYGPDGPRPPPKLFMWPADEVGQVHRVVSPQGKWQCSGSVEECQSKDPVVLELEVISQRPRAFVIKDFLSAHEADTIIQMSKDRLHRSTVGEIGISTGVSETRSSTNTWLRRNLAPELESLTRRAADLLQIDEKLLNVDQNCEELQVVHYSIGQKYDAHHDWGVAGYAESRYITLLFYLNDMKHQDAGGETAFPKGADGRGVKVHPGKGSAVLFYNLLPDGNSDDLSLHVATPPRDGEKWLANYWIWDPKRK